MFVVLLVFVVQVYVVTGSTSGIGLETARRLLRSGARVIMASRNTDRASELLAEWEKQYPEITGKGKVGRVCVCVCVCVCVSESVSLCLAVYSCLLL